MLSKQSINVCLVSDLFKNYHLTDSTIVVVVDLLRATSVISTAFHYGIKDIIPVSSVADAKKFLNTKNTIVAAERNAEALDGFDYGNSPFQYMNSEIKNKTLVLTTTNGTKAINMAKKFQVITACFINADSICNYLINSKRDILILCSGWKGVFNLEDSIFSGYLIDRLTSRKEYNINCDSAQVSQHLNKLAEADYFKFLSNSAHRKRLKNLNIEKDTIFCLNPNISSSIIPTLVDGRLVQMNL